MKAPDKIYLPIVNMGVEDGECTAPIWWNKDKTAEHSEVVKAIEYIRKDLLLEWAKELTSEPYDRTTVSALKHQIAHYLLEKYNSL